MMTMTIQALSSSMTLSTQPVRQRFFLRRFIEVLVAGRQHKADLYIVEYLDRHPEYRDLHARTHDGAGALDRGLADR
jgi:hypothetical protein